MGDVWSAGTDAAAGGSATSRWEKPLIYPREVGRPAFKSLAWRAHVLRTWLLILILGNAIGLILAIDYRSKLKPGSMAGRLFTDPSTLSAQHHLALADLLQTLAYLFCAVLWIIWFHRAYKNLFSFGLGLRFGSGWAIGGWFVPILNLWRPKEIANDIWRGSSAEAEPNSRWHDLPVPKFVHWWWAIYLLSGFLSRGAGISGGNLHGERTAAVLDAMSDVAVIVAAILALMFVWNVTRRQEGRAA